MSVSALTRSQSLPSYVFSLSFTAVGFECFSALLVLTLLFVLKFARGDEVGV